MQLGEYAIASVLLNNLLNNVARYLYLIKTYLYLV